MKIIDSKVKTGAMMVLSTIILSTSCEQLIEIDSPKGQLTTDKIFVDDQTAYSSVVSSYYLISNISSPYITAANEMAADNILIRSGTGLYAEFNVNTVSPGNLYLGTFFWTPLYQNIYNANKILEGLESADKISQNARIQIEGEVRFIRALCYFYLVNMFGDIPLITDTNIGITGKTPRTDKNAVYNLIIDDLEKASSLLSLEYPTGEKVRANKWTSLALLARVYLYTGNWKNAESASNEIIASKTYSLDILSDVFLKNSAEAIFQIWRQDGYFTLGAIYIPYNTTSLPNHIFTDDLLKSFEGGDQRKLSWINSKVTETGVYYYPYKYKQRAPNTGPEGEYDMILTHIAHFYRKTNFSRTFSYIFSSQ